MSYQADLSMKVVRTRHIVKFREGTQALSLKRDLENVPDEASLKVIGEKDDEIKLIFETERPGE